MQGDHLLSLHNCLLDRWNKPLWLKAEDEIFNKLAELDNGFLSGSVV
jgi:hypothetical protein